LTASASNRQGRALSVPDTTGSPLAGAHPQEA
jgi:hypothetical protein